MKRQHSCADSFRQRMSETTRKPRRRVHNPAVFDGNKDARRAYHDCVQRHWCIGDYFLKLASAREQPLRTSWFYLGFALYASTAFGWVFVMKHLKLATISVLYSVSLVLLLTAIGVLLFHESLNYFEVIGIVLAVISLVLLMRFA